MPRRASSTNPLLRFISWLDWSPYASDENDAVPLWFTVLAIGPSVRGAKPVSTRCRDAIHFGTCDSYTKRKKSYLDKNLTAGKTITLPFLLDTSYSDNREDQEWEDHAGEGCTIELSADSYGRLKADVKFDDPAGWIAFAKDLYQTRLKVPELLKHHECRMWQLLSWISPILRESAAVALRRPLENLLHVELDLSLAAFGSYLSVIPTRIQQRTMIVRALLRDDSVFTMSQIGIIFPYDTGAFGSERAHLAPARYETVKSLIEAARIQPVCEGRYSTRQIVDQVLPTACNQPKAQGRYHEVRDELRNLGIDVPDQPVVKADS